MFHDFIAETGASTIIEQGGFPIKHNADGSVAITAKPREARVFNGRKYAVDLVTIVSYMWCVAEARDLILEFLGLSWKRLFAATLRLSRRGKETPLVRARSTACALAKRAAAAARACVRRPVVMWLITSR